MTAPNEPWGVAARRHEIPTHLDVEDRLLFGLPARRALALLSSLAVAFSLWHQVPALPETVRAALAGRLRPGRHRPRLRPPGRPRH